MRRWKNGSEPAAPLGSRLIVQLTFDDVDNLAGHVAEEANHCAESRVGARAGSVCDRRANVKAMFTDEEARPGTAFDEARPFTVEQGRYLAFIYYYTKIHRRPPAESDFQRFCVSIARHSTHGPITSC